MGMPEVATCDDLVATMAVLKPDLVKFRQDFKRALVLHTIVIVVLNVTLIKLLP